MEAVTHTYIDITTTDVCHGREVWADGRTKKEGSTLTTSALSVLFL